LSELEAVVPNTFFQSVETIWSLVFKFAASNIRDASVAVDIPASNKPSPIPAHCLLLIESLPNTAPKSFAVVPALQFKSLRVLIKEKKVAGLPLLAGSKLNSMQQVSRQILRLGLQLENRHWLNQDHIDTRCHTF